MRSTRSSPEFPDTLPGGNGVNGWKWGEGMEMDGNGWKCMTGWKWFNGWKYPGDPVDPGHPANAGDAADADLRDGPCVRT